LRSLADKCEKSVFGTAAEAVQDLSIPRVKDYRPYATFKGQLTLGDPEKYDTAMCIDIERYFRTKVAKPPSASSYVVAEMGGDIEGDVKMEDIATQDDALTAVKNARTYKIVDETAPGGKRDVDRDDLAQGFEYGRTAVAIAESDQNITKLETVASFSIVGFIPAEKVSSILPSSYHFIPTHLLTYLSSTSDILTWAKAVLLLLRGQTKKLDLRFHLSFTHLQN
jgi:ATP-dependent DNA helicase 2 subunit 2